MFHIWLRNAPAPLCVTLGILCLAGGEREYLTALNKKSPRPEDGGQYYVAALEPEGPWGPSVPSYYGHSPGFDGMIIQRVLACKSHSEAWIVIED